MRTLKLSALAVLTAMFFTACGDDVTQVTQETSGLEVVASADSLGKCTEERSGEMKFASKENAVYVCADSAWQNVSAAKKASCAAEILKDSSGYKIICDGDSVGVVFNGKDGSNGETGEAGVDGKFCTVEESPLLDSDFGRGGYVVVCGDDTVGTLRDGLAGEGCTLTDNGDGTVTQDCGGETVTLYKAFCGGKVYDPDSSFCHEDSVITLCGGKSYDLTENFCFGDLIYALCNGKIYDPQDSVCHEERLFGFFEDARDGQVYRMVQIGTQTWMAENLNYAYLQKTATEDSSSFCYNGSSEYCEKYGRLYTWFAAMDACPEDWHLPDTTEWNQLETFVVDSLFRENSDSVGYALKSTTGWVKDNGKTGGSDAFGFGAFPAGLRTGSGATYDAFRSAFFWSSIEYSDYQAYYLYLNYDETGLYMNRKHKDNFLFSVRCIKDEL